MARSSPFPTTNEYSLNTSDTPTQIADTELFELHDIFTQLYEQDNQDDVQIQHLIDETSTVASLASDSCFCDYSAYGIVDSLTLVNCRHFIPEIVDAGDLTAGHQEENSSALRESMNSQERRHRRSGIRRVSIEDAENIVCTYIVQTKKE